MGNKSRLRNLGIDAKTRIKLALEKPFNQGRLTGQAFQLYRKLKPMEAHIEAGCPNCSPLFNGIKKCPDILALPEGSDREAQAHIISHLECRQKLKLILDCPIWAKNHAAQK